MTNERNLSTYKRALSAIRFNGLQLWRLLTVSLLLLTAEGALGQPKNQMVRIAKIVVDPAQLESYKAALKEEIEAPVRLEPGVLTLYAVAEKDNPTHITIFGNIRRFTSLQGAHSNPSFSGL